MTTIRYSLVLALLSLIGLNSMAAPAKADVEIDFDTYAAVAYSPKTGKYGYAWNWRSRAQAERVALANCIEADAKVVGWVKAGWLVLAVSDDNDYGVGYAFGQGASTRDAKIDALNECAKHNKGKNPPKIKVLLCSGNYAPQVYGK
ncbi:MAG: DUF4189 domain-containing protein [Planctomycetes bacterium]|nr:DUF4189 domain-containing protein [Planctomycetota bacterium]